MGKAVGKSKTRKEANEVRHLFGWPSDELPELSSRQEK
jgi:hypothetical protein